MFTLTDILNWTFETDTIRKEIRVFGNYYFPTMMIAYSLGMTGLFYTNPHHVVFIYGVLELDDVPMAWISFLTLDLLVVMFYVGALAFYGHLFVILSCTIIQGTKYLRFV